ncbi:MAG TPA: endolytic transglycosylase MltG [Streptosporangiaceae bacterium]
MSRHSAPGTDGVYGDGTWLPGGSSAVPPEDGGRRRRQSARHAADPPYQPDGSAQTSLGSDSPTAPPWEQPDWEDTGSLPPGPGPADLAGKHPSEPLPSLPPLLPEGDWAEAAPAYEYAGEAGPETGYHGTGYDGDAGDTGGGYAGDRPDDTGFGYAGYAGTGYDPGSYPEAGYLEGYDDTGTGFPATNGGFPPVTGEFPAASGDFTDTGAGYADPAYADGPFTDGAGRYPDDGDYPAGDEYLRYGEPTAGPDGGGYPGREGWYEDTGVHSGWAEGDDSGFLPGMGSGTGDEAGGHPGERRPDGRGGRRGSTGPGKQSAARPGPGRSGPGTSGTSGGGKRKSGIRRWAPWLALSVVVALVIGAGAGYFYVYRTYLHPPDFAGSGTTPKVVRIFPGDTASVVGQRLQQVGVVASARAFSNAAKASGQGSSLEPGYYRVRLHMNAALAFALLLKPSSRMLTKVTIPEGWRLSQIIAALGRDTGNPQGYQQAIKNVAALSLPSFAKDNPEGYLFPATYSIQPNTPPLKVLQDMVTRFDQEAASIHLPAAAAHAELTQSDVIIVASLIQAEGRRPADFPKIARVIYNRLNSSPQIRLQLDSTVMYALHKYGIIASSQQIKVKSRYNTYLHTGLPPGPIDSPGAAAINAALHPAHGTWMYFVTVDPKTGETKFTSSFTQFQRFRTELEANIAKGK